MIIDKINKFLSDKKTTVDTHLKYNIEKLAGFAFQRQFMDEHESKPGVLRLSHAGKCPRQVAYKYHDFPAKGKEMDARASIIFFQGDLVELMLMSLARLSGCNITGYGLDQLKVTFPILINGEIVNIDGHPDGILIEKGAMVVECKSMASYSYERFDKGEVDDSYRAQINMYLTATGLEQCVMIAMNKDNGVLGEKIIDRDNNIISKCENDFISVIKSTKEALPDPMYVMDEKGYYPWQCLYCSHWGHCRPNAEKVLKGNSYKLKEKFFEEKPKQKPIRM